MKYISFVLLFVFSCCFSFAQNDSSSKNFPVITPESQGIDSNKLQAIAEIAQKAIKAHAFPGCQVLVARNGKVVYYKTFGFLNYDQAGTGAAHHPLRSCIGYQSICHYYGCDAFIRRKKA